MKTIPGLLLVISSLVAPFAAAAEPNPAAGAPEHWVEPAAQKILDRLTAAYAGVTAWTSTFTKEERRFQNNVEQSGVGRSVERFLKTDNAIPCYAATNYYGDQAMQIVAQNSAEFYEVRPAGSEPVGMLTNPNANLAPLILSILKSFVKDARYIRSWGKETVADQPCDVLEVTVIVPGKPTDNGTTPAPLVTSVRCWVDAAGFIERLVRSTSSLDGTFSVWNDYRITFDAHASLTAEDFSRASFERDVTPFLKGKPMPALTAKQFKQGDSLPAVSFIAWADKKPFQLSEFHGKVVVLETWASWCYYCKQAFPFYEQIRQKLADQGVVFVAVSFDAKQADYEKWMNAHSADYGFKFGRIDSADPMKAMNEFKGSLPAFYVLGKDGKIVSSYLGNSYDSGQEDPRLLTALRQAGVKL